MLFLPIPVCLSVSETTPPLPLSEPGRIALRKAMTLLDGPREITPDTPLEARTTKAKDLTARIRLLRDSLQSPDDRAALQVALCKAWSICLGPEDKDLSEETLRLVPAGHAAWTLFPRGLDMVAKTLGDKGQGYMARAARESASPEVREVALAGQAHFALEIHDERRWAWAYPELARLAPEAWETQQLAKDRVQYEKTRPGIQAPDINLPALGGTGNVHLADLRGKTVLIDFWATWCAPCRKELPHLQELQRRHQDRGFVILSLSCDKKAEDLTAFRQRPDTPMPWLHAFLPGGTRHPVAAAYGVTTIPKPILVGPDGKVLAVGNELRGDRLEATVLKHLGPAGLDPAAKAVLDQARNTFREGVLALRLNREQGLKDTVLFTEAVQALAAAEKDESRPTVKHAQLLAMLSLSYVGQDPPEALCRRILQEVSPSFAGWAHDPKLVGVLNNTMSNLPEHSTYPDLLTAYRTRMEQEHPDPAVREGLLADRVGIALYRSQVEELEAILKELSAQHPSSRYLPRVQTALEAARKEAIIQAGIRPGNPAPDFTLPSLDPKAPPVSLKALRGKYVLLDFWATWCGPCKAEMPGLHAAQAAFAPKGLVVLSLSSDRKPEDVAVYRAQKGTPMPWLHVFLGTPAGREVAKAYGISGIPKPILIGPDGRIVAMDQDLRGEKLQATLSALLK